MKIEISLADYEDFNPMTFANAIINMRILNNPLSTDEYNLEIKWIEQLSEHLNIWTKYTKEMIND